MLVAERYEKITALVNERGSMRVTELAELCQVTEETIRRDLDKLEEAGRLKRSHGGAVSVKELSAQQETPYFVREIANAEEKKRIAEEAVSLVKSGDRILLDASSTAWYMAQSMPNLPMTVLTNSIKVAAALSGKEKIQVLSTGGLLAHRSLSFVGPLAEKTLDEYHVSQAFMSCKGVHYERGLSESSELQARMKQKMVGMADRVILLADASKFGAQEFARVADLDAVHTIITDRALGEEDHYKLVTRGIHVKLV